MQNTEAAKKLLETAHNSQRRILAPCKSELVAKYLNAFSRFIKSKDFNKLH
jgi:hypothetical protein